MGPGKQEDVQGSPPVILGKIHLGLGGGGKGKGQAHMIEQRVFSKTKTYKGNIQKV